MADLQANIDAYGTYARASALADYAEVVARGTGSFAEANLADLLKDSGWVRRMHDLVRLPDDRIDEEPVEIGDPDVEGGIDEEPWRAAAGTVFDVLRDRAATLGDSYPFDVSEVLVPRAAPGAFADLYLALLALTISHAYGIDCHGLDPKQIFEDSVEATLVERGLLAANLGRRGRAGMQFDDLVIEAGQEVGLRPTPGAAPRRVYANEERVDTLAHLDWHDDRGACWTFIGQATCAASDEWPRKLAEPGVAIWRDYLGINVQPQPFLAVPHHVERPMYDYLVRSDEKMVLDRLRLCRRANLLEAESLFLECLDALDVDDE